MRLQKRFVRGWRTEAEIFITQKHIMNDPKVVQAVISKVVNQRRNLESGISEVLSSYEERFASHGQSILT
jgi:phosphoenolpyruvate-protein kinase (PTS system EI component)